MTNDLFEQEDGGGLFLLREPFPCEFKHIRRRAGTAGEGGTGQVLQEQNIVAAGAERQFTGVELISSVGDPILAGAPKIGKEPKGLVVTAGVGERVVGAGEFIEGGENRVASGREGGGGFLRLPCALLASGDGGARGDDAPGVGIKASGQGKHAGGGVDFPGFEQGYEYAAEVAQIARVIGYELEQGGLDAGAAVEAGEREMPGGAEPGGLGVGEAGSGAGAQERDLSKHIGPVVSLDGYFQAGPKDGLPGVAKTEQLRFQTGEVGLGLCVRHHRGKGGIERRVGPVAQEDVGDDGTRGVGSLRFVMAGEGEERGLRLGVVEGAQGGERVGGAGEIPGGHAGSREGAPRGGIFGGITRPACRLIDRLGPAFEQDKQTDFIIAPDRAIRREAAPRCPQSGFGLWLGD